MAWTNIDNALVSVGALPFATTIQALRDNPIAIANGDAGAPKVQTAAIQDGAVQVSKLATGAGEAAWVGARNIQIGVGGIGTYAFLAYPGNTSQRNPGFDTSGTNLLYGPGVSGAPAPSGTWRLCGFYQSGGGSAGGESPSLWLRIA
jgi:hypothetical protein